MNTAQIAAIKEMALILPQFQQTRMRMTPGIALLGIGITEWQGAQVKAEKNYPVPVMKATNTVRSLMRMAEKKGWDNMLAYVHRVRSGQESIALAD